MSTIEERFIHLYNNTSMCVPKIKKELNLTHNEYTKLRNSLNQKGLLILRGFKKKRTKKREVKNYSYSNTLKVYDIRKRNRYYGTVKTKEQAERYVELLKQNNWNIEKRWELKLQAIKEVGN